MDTNEQDSSAPASTREIPFAFAGIGGGPADRARRWFGLRRGAWMLPGPPRLSIDLGTLPASPRGPRTEREKGMEHGLLAESDAREDVAACLAWLRTGERSGASFDEAFGSLADQCPSEFGDELESRLDEGPGLPWPAMAAIPVPVGSTREAGEIVAPRDALRLLVRTNWEGFDPELPARAALIWVAFTAVRLLEVPVARIDVHPVDDAVRSLMRYG